MSWVDARAWLELVKVETAVYQLRPDYQVALIVAEGLVPGDSDDASESVLSEAESRVRARLASQTLDEIPQLVAWRDAYRSFGAKPQKYRPSVEALVRRVDEGLPRIDRITDTYNAISIGYLLPLGGEDADKYVGAPKLIRAVGDEEFEILASGEPVAEHSEPGEVVWADDAGVTCRRWNWRQSLRTRIDRHTTRAVFIIDALTEVTTEAELLEAATALEDALARFSPGVQFVTRMITRNA